MQRIFICISTDQKLNIFKKGKILLGKFVFMFINVKGRVNSTRFITVFYSTKNYPFSKGVFFCMDKSNELRGKCIVLHG